MSIRQRAEREWTELAPPVLVLSANANPRSFPLHLPADLSNATAVVEVVHEDGAVSGFAAPLREIAEAESAEIGGRRYVRKMVRLPDSLAIGYYDVTVMTPGRPSAAMRLILAPDRAYLPEKLRAAGLAVSLYGVRSARNWGAGDFTDLHSLVTWVAEEVNASFIGLNPLHAIHNRKPYNTSPYLPNSIFYQNYLYLDVERVPDFGRSRRAQALWGNPVTQEALAKLRGSQFVEYEAVAGWKLRFMKLCFLEFLRTDFRTGSPRDITFQAFRSQESELLERFSLFCALDEHIHQRNPAIWIWPDWPEPYRDPDSRETKGFSRKHWRRVLFYQYLQWQIDLQLADAQDHANSHGLSLGLYHDLALATDRCGADLWAHRSFYVSGCRVGSPPDDFAPQGQDWAFPPPNSLAHRADGYRLFAESIRNNCRHGGALRLDHVMRLFRLYWIPDGLDATQGAYVRDRYEDLVRILALESVRNRVVLVGEDLGTVQPHVRDILHSFGILSYRLFYFERTSSGDFVPFDQYPAQALVSSTTHDLPTLAGFWASEDIEARRRAGVLDETSYQEQLAGRARDRQRILNVLFQCNLLPSHYSRSAADIREWTGELHNAVIGFLASGPSQLLLVNQEDLTKEIHQQNLPSTTWQYPNWSRKMKFTVEELLSEKTAKDFAAMFRNWLIRTGRTNRLTRSNPDSTEQPTKEAV